jgi:hypothetical protein
MSRRPRLRHAAAAVAAVSTVTMPTAHNTKPVKRMHSEAFNRPPVRGTDAAIGRLMISHAKLDSGFVEIDAQIDTIGTLSAEKAQISRAESAIHRAQVLRALLLEREIRRFETTPRPATRQPVTVSIARLVVTPKKPETLTGDGLLFEIAGCESGSGPKSTPDYTAGNDEGSSASGAWQDLDSTWHDFDGYPRAMDAPPSVQLEFNTELFDKDGTAPWDSSRSCWE